MRKDPAYITLKKPMRCLAADDTEPALVFTMRSRMTHYYKMGIGQWSISQASISQCNMVKVNWREDEIISSLSKVTIRPRKERVEDMNVKGRPFRVKVPTFHLKSKPQSLGQIN